MYLLIWNNIQEVVGPGPAGELRIWPGSKCTSQAEMPLELCPLKSLLLFFLTCIFVCLNWIILFFLEEGGTSLVYGEKVFCNKLSCYCAHHIFNMKTGHKSQQQHAVAPQIPVSPLPLSLPLATFTPRISSERN